MNRMPFQNNWVPRRGDQGPKTIDQIHKEAELEEHREQIKVQQQLLSKKDTRGSQGAGGRSSSGPHPAGSRISVPQDEGWNTVPISTKNRPIDTSRLSKITKVSGSRECRKWLKDSGSFRDECSAMGAKNG